MKKSAPSLPVALVTGGANGIGCGVVRLFAQKGYHVFFGDLDVSRGRDLQAELRANGWAGTFREVDVRNPDALEGVVQAASAGGRLDALVNNVGIERNARLEDTTLQDWEDMVSVNLRSAFLCSRHAIGALRAAGGSIVNISSVQSIANEPGLAIYVSTKAGLLGMTRALAIDLAPHRIRVNAVCPGAIQTAMMDVWLESKSDPKAVLAQMTRNIPLGRLGTPEDVAELVLFLASGQARYITGGTFVVDGGLVARLGL